MLNENAQVLRFLKLNLKNNEIDWEFSNNKFFQRFWRILRSITKHWLKILKFWDLKEYSLRKNLKYLTILKHWLKILKIWYLKEYSLRKNLKSLIILKLKIYKISRIQRICIRKNLTLLTISKHWLKNPQNK